MVNQSINVVLVITIILSILSIANAVVWIYAFRSIRSSLRKLTRLGSGEHGRRSRVNVSVIIPVRNEEETISRLLNSLLDQVGIDSMEIIVVDDGSTDRTAAIVREFMGKSDRIRYVRIDEIPRGWAPKPYLYYTGYGLSCGEVLFFIDGDTWIKTQDLLSRVTELAMKTNGIVSLLPRFSCRTVRCRIIETLLTTFSHAFLGFDKVFDRGKRFAWYYGCCWAIRRDLYEELGTHKVVRESIVEDKDFAEYIKSRGYEIKVAYTPMYVETKWYDGIGDTIDVLARVLKGQGIKRSRAIAGSILILLGYYLPIINMIYGLLVYPPLLLLGIIQYILLTMDHCQGAHVNGYSKLYSIVAPLLGIALSIGLFKAALAKNIVWRGRIIEEPLRIRHDI